MRWRNLIPLVAILLALVGLIVFKQAKQQPLSLEEAVQLARLIPEDLTKADIAKMELYAGPKPEGKVVLERVPDVPDEWQITSYYNAPADNRKIGDFLNLLVALRGEPREKGASDQSLNQYELTDNRAFHVRGYKKDIEGPVFDILVGKQADYRQVFARTAGSKDVLVLDKSPRRDAGLWQDDMEKAPEASQWVDKTVLGLGRENITKLDIKAPHKRLLFERREKPASTSQETPPESTEAPSSEEEFEEKPGEPEYEWVLAEGGGGRSFKQPGLDSLLGAFGSLTALDVVDPTQKAEWGLDPPSFVCTVGAKDLEQDIVLEGGRPDPAGDGYIRVAGRRRDTVYKVSKYNFERVFALYKDLGLFDLEGLSLTADDIKRVEVTQPEGAIVLMRGEDNKWEVAEPEVNLEAQATTLNTLGSTLARWKAAEYADSPEALQLAGLESPARKVTFYAGTEESHTIEVGNDAEVVDGAYARLDGSDKVLLMSRTDMTKIFVSPKDLYQRRLLDLFEDDVKTIAIERETEPLTLARNEADEERWDLTAAGETVEVDGEALEALLTALEDLELEDILFGNTTLPEGPEATVRCATDDGAEHVLLFGPEADGKRTVALAGKGVVGIVDASEAEKLLPSLDSLKPAPPAQPADEAAGEVVPAEAEETAVLVEEAAPEAGGSAGAPEPGETEAESQ